jgi:hypothetical protein
MYSLIESNYRKSITKEALIKIIEIAKQRSEVAPGVGKITKTVQT